MKENNLILEKSYEFAIRVVNTCRQISVEQKEFILTNQLLRSGTSIGANIEEAIGGQPRKDFHAKLCIAYKEAREASYGIRLMTDTGFIDKNLSESLLLDNEEILKIVGSIIKTLRQTNS